jgi:general secretion pathway protein C
MVLARRPRLAIEWLLLALVVYLAALGASVAVRLALVDDLPAPPSAAPAAPSAARPPAPLADYAVIAERDIFNPSRATAGEPHHRSALRLWGVALEGREARAVIEDTATHRQDLYRVGDRVGDARIAAIDWDRVTLTHAGGEEALELAPPGTAAASDDATDGRPAGPVTGGAAPDDRIRRTGENAFVVDRRELAGAVDNMSGLLTQLRAVPEVREGRPAGFRLFQVRGDGLFARLGLRDGDVVQRVNGQEVGEPSALLGFLQRLRSEPRVALDIVRGDAPRTLVYDLR